MNDKHGHAGRIEFIDLKAQQSRIRESVERRIRAVLDHGAYILGPEVEELEQALARIAGVKHAVSCANGTDALQLALMALGIGPGDAVFVPAFTFFATAEVVSLVGATPVFVDIDEKTFNLDPRKLEEAVSSLSRTRPALKPRCVIPVDLFGLPADYQSLRAVAGKHGLKMIQDAAQSFGATYQGARVGAQGDIAATSFFPAKPLGCYGDGGALFTDDDRAAELLRSLRFHGKGSDKYDNVRIGLNSRLDTIQAAVLLAKLEVFEDEIAARQTVAGRYSSALRDLPESQARVRVPFVPEASQSAWAQYSVLCASTNERAELMKRLQAQGIPSMIYYPKPLHLQKAFAGLGHGAGSFPVAESVAGRILSLPMHPYLTEVQQARVCAAILG